MKKVTSAAAKTLVKDEWVTTAMTDDEMVVELLIRLKHAGTVVSEDPSTNLPPLRWGVRQRRSRSSRFGVVSLKKDVDSARGSPKTPLSWSGGGSESPSADGFEDTSLQASCSTSTGSGSKAFPTNEITSSFSKRLKIKKKSSSELKYQENLKLKERTDLEKEIASLRETFDEQNVRNQRLKRIKLDLNSGRVKNETLADLTPKPQGESKSRRAEDNKTASLENKDSFFFLPDLNMVPTEDEILYGTS
ncbi:hypothetical protein IGI04_000568 [Brassica rapa subsp. trilocularis]|uniref:NPH3 domain-containing protein n=1 Tax=Brassica rapa subsp. trilocularis TaxID=1813537 RepID=A0ABQ7NS80_BRACM|nr:hypothetical protein IGI04_000568 [Brassica rapa subsp. trilocularis]